MDKDWALLYGILAGDSCLSRCCRQRIISICGHLKDDRLFFDKIISPLINKLREKQTKYKLYPKYNKIEFNFSDKILFNKLKNLGFPVGKKKKQKIILPNKLKKYHKQFIAGLIATDGSIWFRYKNYKKPYPCIGFKNYCKSLVDEAYKYMKLLNLNPKLREVKYKINPQSGEYEIAIYGYERVALFDEIIGFINPKHKEKYELKKNEPAEI